MKPLQAKHARLLIVVCILIAFGRLCTGEFTLWDDQLIYRSPDFNPPSIDAVVRHWSQVGSSAKMTIYIPLTYTLWAIFAKVGYVPTADEAGIHLNPWIFHTGNVLIHVATALAAFQLLRLLLRDDRRALIGTLFYSLHPVMVESVGWVSGLKDVLSGTFMLMSAINYVRCAQPRADQIDPPRLRGNAYYALSILCALLAMLSKPAAIVMPALFLLVDHYLLHRFWKDALRSIWPFFILALPFVINTRLAQPAHLIIYPLWSRPFIALDAIAFYLYKIVWPIHLSIDYVRGPERVLREGWWMYTSAAAIVIGLIVFFLRRRLPMLMTGMLWLVICLLPVLGLVPFLMQFFSTVADHYLYTALFGIALFLASIVPIEKPAAVLVTIAIILLLMTRTFLATAVWKNNTTLHENALAYNPNSIAGLTDLGIDAADRHDYPRAEKYLRRVTELDRRTPIAAERLARIYAETNDVDRAIDMTRLSIEIRQQAPKALNWDPTPNQLFLARLLISRGRTEEARELLESAAKQRPNDPAIQQQLNSLHVTPQPAR